MICVSFLCARVRCKKIRQMAYHMRSALLTGIFLHENTQENQDLYSAVVVVVEKEWFSLKIFQFFLGLQQNTIRPNLPRLLHEVNVACFFSGNKRMSLVEISVCIFWPLQHLNMQRCNQPTEQFFVILFSNCLFYMPGDTKEQSEIFDHLKEWKSWAHMKETKVGKLPP